MVQEHKKTKKVCLVCLCLIFSLTACQSPNLNSNTLSESKDKIASGLPLSLDSYKLRLQAILKNSQNQFKNMTNLSFSDPTATQEAKKKTSESILLAKSITSELQQIIPPTGFEKQHTDITNNYAAVIAFAQAFVNLPVGDIKEGITANKDKFKGLYIDMQKGSRQYLKALLDINFPFELFPGFESLPQTPSRSDIEKGLEIMTDASIEMQAKQFVGETSPLPQLKISPNELGPTPVTSTSPLPQNDYSGCWTSSDKVSTIKLVIAKGKGSDVYSFWGNETPVDGSTSSTQEGTFKEITNTEVELTYTKPMALILKAKVTGTPKDKLFEFEALNSSGTTTGTRTAYRPCS